MGCDCVLIGRLTKDCEQRPTKNGKLIYTLSVASNRGFGDSQQTDYFDCMAFHPTLEKQYQHLTKGCMVKIVGHMQSHKTDKGVLRWTVVVDSLEMLWTKPKIAETPAPEEDGLDMPF